MSALDPFELRSAFGKFMTGVTVVTAISAEGSAVGFTANSYTSVSLDPPLLLVCPAKTLSSYPVFAACETFAVNILAEDQRHVSNIFVSSKDDRFSQISWRRDGLGNPIIDGAAASFSCIAHERIEAGDHLILMGRINSFETTGAGGLGFANGGYFSLGMERRVAELPSTKRSVTVGAIVEHEGRVLIEERGEGACLPRVAATARAGSIAVIERLFSEAGMEVAFGPVYSIFENHKTGDVSTYYRGVAKGAHAGGLGQFVSIDALSSYEFETVALGDMIRRYRLERQNGIFGLYVGDDVEGDVHMFGEGVNS
jgi:flavin reductase (DIM6/NTAB) family NADH-FMN oxidoreductase RutF